MILILCSEPLIRSILKDVLTAAGYVVQGTGDLGTAVDILADSKIDLLITYPYVEGLPGHEAAKYLRGKNPQMGILIVAGLLEDVRLQNRSAFEGFEEFPQPFTADQLIEKIEQVLRASQKRAARH